MSETTEKTTDDYRLKATVGVQIEAPQLPYQPCDPQSYRPNIGLIGCGSITASHLEAYKKASLNVVALCDKDESRARARQSEFFPDAAVYTEPHRVLERDDIEVVDLATHPADRANLIEQALIARKHVLSQKPFVLDLDFGERLADLADAQNVRLAVNQNGRWAPHFSYLRHAIEAGLIGEVVSAHLGVHWDHSWIKGTPFEEIHHVVLYDFSIHWFDALTTFMGKREPQRVFSTVTRSIGQDIKPPLLAQVLVVYEGAQASLTFDADVKFGAQDRTYIAGTKGTLTSSGADLGSQSVTLFTEAGHATPKLEGAWFPDGFHGTMSELLCAIEENREPSNGARGNLRSLALAFAAIQSAETGQPQTPGQVRQLPRS